MEPLKYESLKTGECLHSLGENTEKIEFVTFSPSGLLVASSGKRSLVLWDVRTGNLRPRLKVHSVPVKTLKFSSEETLIASATSFASTVRVWNIATSKELLCHGTTTWLPNLDFTDDDAHVHVDHQVIPIRSTALLAAFQGKRRSKRIVATQCLISNTPVNGSYAPREECFGCPENIANLHLSNMAI
jgi:WD40 repeat protein